MIANDVRTIADNSPPATGHRVDRHRRGVGVQPRTNVGFRFKIIKLQRLCVLARLSRIQIDMVVFGKSVEEVFAISSYAVQSNQRSNVTLYRN